MDARGVLRDFGSENHVISNRPGDDESPGEGPQEVGTAEVTLALPGGLTVEEPEATIPERMRGFVEELDGLDVAPFLKETDAPAVPACDSSTGTITLKAVCPLIHRREFRRGTSVPLHAGANPAAPTSA